ncbi:response regulator transcription factor [Paraliomyxa miuraensis]|uniref:response regulator transcription factor n=1 Tax=Paraliomyxa miuraensis TaxID=376150 RepID=UPI00225AC8C7|nr:response regulator transcription factor [Paraliomyxa miuraensis]MCX4245195.1 response regulator transcription factor [Paraliomyxa miuraensis]
MSTTPTRLVVADDHHLVREALARLLDGEPDLHVQAECTDGDAALAKIRELVPDVAVLDMSMPGRSGLEVAMALEADGPSSTRVVMLTARRAPELARRALEHGVHGIVLKEDAFDDLLYAIRAAVEGRRFVSAALAGGVLTGELQERALSEREHEVLRLVSQGLTNAQIGAALGISAKTIDNHRTRIMRKLDAHSLADLVRHAIRIGLVDP